MRIRNYRDLDVWQVGMKVAQKVYLMTEKFPQSEEYGLRSQMRRSTVSIPSNIEEGHSRNHTTEFIHFFR